MNNELILLIIGLFVAFIIAGLLMYYLFKDKKYISKIKQSNIKEQKANIDLQKKDEPIPLVIDLKKGLDKVNQNADISGLESLLKDIITRQNNIGNNINILTQKTDDLEKNISLSQKNLLNSYAQVKPKIDVISNNNPNDLKTERLITETEKMLPLVKDIINASNSIVAKLQFQEDMLKTIKDLLQQKTSLSGGETKGIDELNRRVNEITNLLKALSS